MIPLTGCGETGATAGEAEPSHDAAPTTDTTVSPPEAETGSAGSPDAIDAPVSISDAAPVDASAADAPPDLGPDLGRDAARDGTSDATFDMTTHPVPDAAPDAPAACGVCSSYAPAERGGTVQTASLNALSGIASSWRNAGVLYVHNDRNRPEFFALSEAGALLGQFNLTGAVAQDVEDIEVARCPSGTCVYLADLGNNIAARADYAIFRVQEPDVSPARPAGTAQVTFEKFVFTYPDGDHNAESLMVDPNTGAVYVITKVAAGAKSTVYRLPSLDAARAVVAVKVADLPVPAPADQPATAASAHPCGGGFLLRTGNTLYEFRIAPGAPFEDGFRATPAMVPVGMEMQGEGVAYRPDGRGYYTTSEGSMPPIHRVGCR